MIKKLVFSFLFSGFLSLCFSQTINLGTTNVEASVLYTSTDVPWELKYGPGDSLWMTTREGRVVRIHASNGGSTLLLDHTSRTWAVGEAGMLGMTFHPQFTSNPFIYIAYTYLNAQNAPRERLSRFTYTGNTLVNELILIDGIIANATHNGSRLVVLGDNTLLMTTGDAQDQPAAQNVNSLNGKVLRINLDGTIPTNNPNPVSQVYTVGHRNGQGIALHPNGKVYATEHGPNSNDELHIIESGRNYGWPNVHGFCDNDVFPETAFCNANNVKQPLASWNIVPPGDTWAPSDLIWYSHPSIPEFQNSFLITYLKTQKINRVTLNATGEAVASQTDFFVNRWGRLRDIATSPDGQLFLATNTPPYRIIRIRNPNTQVPVILSNFIATCIDGRPVITWQTQSELNLKEFKLYTSSNGIDYQLKSIIPSKAAGGNSNTVLNYTFADNSTLGSNTFYRLESEDIHGRKDFVGNDNVTCEGVFFRLSPNPSPQNTELSWTGEPLRLTIKVFDSKGTKVYEANALSPVLLPSQKWSSGWYVVAAYDDNKTLRFKSALLVQ